MFGERIETVKIMNRWMSYLFLLVMGGLILGIFEIIRHNWRILILIFIVVPNSISRFFIALLPSVFMETACYLGIEGEEVPMRIYHPKKSGKRPTFIIYPGASPTGEEHEILNRLGEGMAKVGLRVFIPRLSAMKDVLIRSETTKEIITSYQQISRRTDVDSRKIATAGVSFSGSLVIKAFSEESVDTLPACILSYGSYFDIENTLRFSLTGDFEDENNRYHLEPQEWGRIVFFHNYLDLVEENLNREIVKRYFLALVRNDDKGAADMFQKMSKQAQMFVCKIVDGDQQETLELAEKIIPELEEINKALSPRYFINRIDFPVYLMHGSLDDMIPFTETVKFSRALKSEGKNVETYISHLHGHSEVENGENGMISTIGELWEMATFLKKVFSTIT